MPSSALKALLVAVQEVHALQKSNPSPTSLSRFGRPEVKRAIGRAQVVLLSSHFERYMYDLNEEAVDYLLSVSIKSALLPVKIRLLHSRSSLELISQTSWERREKALTSFARQEAPLWNEDGFLEEFQHGRLLEWMKAPRCEAIKRYFEQWQVPDIFSSITRKSSVRSDLWLRIDELVEKRNNIAHGDLTVEATYLDIQKYLVAIKTFATRADGYFANIPEGLTRSSRPW